jgi:hypothetical protein
LRGRRAASREADPTKGSTDSRRQWIDRRRGAEAAVPPRRPRHAAALLRTLAVAAAVTAAGGRHAGSDSAPSASQVCAGHPAARERAVCACGCFARGRRQAWTARDGDVFCAACPARCRPRGRRRPGPAHVRVVVVTAAGLSVARDWPRAGGCPGQRA